MTRSTAPASCWPIWARLSSGTAGSPRRSAASSAWAASIAFSPPLTATYMDLLLDTRGARHGGQKISAGQDQIEAARKQRRERGPLGPESCPKPGDAELVAVLDPGAGEAQPPAPGEVGDFDHQRGGAVGIGVEPEGETVERRQARRVADEGEGGAVAGFGLGQLQWKRRCENAGRAASSSQTGVSKSSRASAVPMAARPRGPDGRSAGASIETIRPG